MTADDGQPTVRLQMAPIDHGHGVIRPADLEGVNPASLRKAKMLPRAASGEIAACRLYAAAVDSVRSVEQKFGAQCACVAGARLTEVYKEGAAGAEAILEELGRSAQVVDQDIQIAVPVKIGHAHPATPGCTIQLPLGRRLEPVASVVAVGLVFFDELIAGQVAEYLHRGHAVDNVQVE